MKFKSVFVGFTLLAIGSQSFAQPIDHPFIKCNEYEVLANKVMTQRINGTDQKIMVRAMELTGEDPRFGIQANMGLKMIEKAFAVNVPNNTNAVQKEIIIKKFTDEQKQFCKDLLDGKIKIN